MTMAQLVVRNLEAEVKRRLMKRAQRHGHSMEEEARNILRSAVRDEGRSATKLGSRLGSRFAGVGLDAEIPELRGAKLRAVRLGG